MTREKAEQVLGVAISQFLQARMEAHMDQDALDEDQAFQHALVHTLEFCAGSIMTCFFLAVRRGPSGDQLELGEVDGMFKDMMSRVTAFVCEHFPKHLAQVDEIIGREKKGAKR